MYNVYIKGTQRRKLIALEALVKSTWKLHPAAMFAVVCSCLFSVFEQIDT